jgi:hypothetical protein
MDHNFDQNKKNTKEIAGELLILFSFYITYILFEPFNGIVPKLLLVRVCRAPMESDDQTRKRRLLD